ncbi:EAL domain-containing protein [Sulfurimonas sp.]|nr:EAL domain-containing protein [Sulfurimonas sp.]
MDEIKLRSIKVLIIEDSEDDTFLLIRNLKQNYYDPIYTRVETENEMREALNRESWDIIITDHTLPSFSSNKAIKLLNDFGKDIPLLILSGNIDPKIAVEAMRSGAKDFIMKDDTSRLVPAIERELYEKGLRRDKKIADAKIEYLAFHDCLTGLVNRIEFERRLNNALKSSKANNITHAILFMDLDYFKIINDTCGHLAGDELLKQLSSKLLLMLRERDTLARVGGDEFCILLDNCPQDRALEIAKSINAAVKDFNFVWNEKYFKIGISIGVLEVDKDSESTTSVLSDVDVACYAAKENGRNTIQVYEKDIIQLNELRNEINWAGEIDTALENNQFVLYQQSIEPLREGLSPHHEILLRLRKNDELVLPNKFIPAAERYYKMVAIDFWVIDNSLKKLQEISGSDNNYKIAINLSGHTLGSDDLYSHILSCIEKYSIDPNNICFEITETAAISNFEDAKSFFDNIKRMGCKLALDDFGTGFSSFTYLKNMPVDFVKIDGYFVTNIVTNLIDRSIVEAMNDIAHKLGARTIAEFVESKEIREVLIEIGVDYGQGYGIHRPEKF